MDLMPPGGIPLIQESREVWEAYMKRKQEWKKEHSRLTRHLRKVREGTQVKNIQSGQVAAALRGPYQNDPRLPVLFIQKRGEFKGRIVRTDWFAPNVRIHPPKKRKKKQKN